MMVSGVEIRSVRSIGSKGTEQRVGRKMRETEGRKESFSSKEKQEILNLLRKLF